MKNKKISGKILLWIILISLNTNGFSQFLKQKDSYVVYINYPNYSVKTTVSNSTKKIHVDESLTYYWYSSNKIMETKGDYDGKLVDGLYTAFYLSNNLKEKGSFKNGLKNGKWISWYENGKISEIVFWKRGKKSGLYKKFNEDESLNTTATYRNNELHGLKTTYEKGEIVSETNYKLGKEVIRKKSTGKSSKEDSKKTVENNKANKATEKKTTKEPGKESTTDTSKKSNKENSKESSRDTNKASDEETNNHITLKDKISKLFKKDKKVDSITTIKEKAPVVKERKWKEKWDKLFKRKQTASSTEPPVAKDAQVNKGETSPK